MCIRDREKEATGTALLPLLLRRGSRTFPSTLHIARESEELYGSDCLFKPVLGTIKGNKIIINSKEPDIKYVRYGWKPYSVGNLVNENGWPASTFQINCPYP